MIALFTSFSITHDCLLTFLICMKMYYCIVLCVGVDVQGPLQDLGVVQL